MYFRLPNCNGESKKSASRPNTIFSEIPKPRLSAQLISGCSNKAVSLRNPPNEMGFRKKKIKKSKKTLDIFRLCAIIQKLSDEAQRK